MTARRRIHPLIDELAEQRRALDLTRPQAAELAGIAPRTLHAFERGEVNPRLGTLDELAHALGYRVALIPISEKKCLGCGEIKSVRRFGSDQSRPDGLRVRCGSCNAKGVQVTHSTEPGHQAKLANLEKGRLPRRDAGIGVAA